MEGEGVDEHGQGGGGEAQEEVKEEDGARKVLSKAKAMPTAAVVAVAAAYATPTGH